jgi:hypothetical protein
MSRDDKSAQNFLHETRVHKELLQRQEEEIRTILKSDPDLPLRERGSDREETYRQIAELRKLLEACRPYISRIKSFVLKISDESVEAACYLLFCEVFQHFESIFLLAAEGLSVPVNELNRTIAEALDLIVFFESQGRDSSSLRKWFAGEIVQNRKARESAHRFINEGRKDLLPVAALKARIYAGLSKYSHVSYAALLETIDVYERDFDWRRCAGFHYTKSGTLKQFYLSRDPGVVPELDRICEQCIAPSI